MNPMLILLPMLLPLAGVVINAFAGPKLGEKGSGWLATLLCFASFGVSVALFAQAAANPEHAVHADFGPWIVAGPLNVPFGFSVDALSGVLLLIITGVGGLIHLYSIGYMHGDARFSRYFVYLNLFVASMLVLVMASNYLLMFVGWELVGLCSYLLIGFWFDKLRNAEAARKAFVANRIGDVGFVLGLLLMFATFGTFNYADVFAALGGKTVVAPAVLAAITLLLLVGATGKSAQIPLLVWLPDAMAGPTPASALIHAATMVTAGIYMIVRSNPLYHAAESSSEVVAIVGALTAFVAGSIAMRQYDIKKVLAYSTVSQLGFMVAAAGLGAYVAGIFHLLTHAFFKALLFLAAGSVIHGMEHYSHTHAGGEGEAHVDAQDMRNMGGLRKKMPLTFVAYLAGALALAGLPPFSGFWSKDEIVLAALEKSPMVFALLAVTAVFTAFYTGRQIMMVFFGEPRTRDARHAQESGSLMTVPLLVLAVLAVLGGVINLPAGFPAGQWLENWLEPVTGAHAGVGLNLGVAGLFTVLTVGALAAAWYLYRDGKREASLDAPQRGLAGFLNRAWRLDDLYRSAIVVPYFALASFLARVFDLGGIDAVVNGVGKAVQGAATQVRKVQTGFVRAYGLMMLLGVVVLLAWFVLNAR